MNLFQQAEEGFDKLFGYERQQLESFDYQNMMKNGNIIDQLKLQKQELQSSERKTKSIKIIIKKICYLSVLKTKKQTIR